MILGFTNYLVRVKPPPRPRAADFEEFRNLWNILNGWKQVFLQADQGKYLPRLLYSQLIPRAVE